MSAADELHERIFGFVPPKAGTAYERLAAVVLAELNLSLKDPLLQSAALGLQHLAQRLGRTTVGIEKVVLGGHAPLLSRVVGRVRRNEKLDIAPLTPHRDKFQLEAHDEVLVRPDLPQQNDGDVLIYSYVYSASRESFGRHRHRSIKTRLIAYADQRVHRPLANLLVPVFALDK